MLKIYIKTFILNLLERSFFPSVQSINPDNAIDVLGNPYETALEINQLVSKDNPFAAPACSP